MDTFSSSELAYLSTQRLGRLATVDRSGTPQNSPVSFRVVDGAVLIRGFDLGSSRKFRNARDHGRVSFVVDDIVSIEPWRVRAVEIRGAAETLTDVDPPPTMPYVSREEIRIRPERIVSWGLDVAVGDGGGDRHGGDGGETGTAA